MIHSRKNRTVRKPFSSSTVPAAFRPDAGAAREPFSSRAVPAALRPDAGAALTLAAFLTLFPKGPLPMEAAAQSRPVAINAGSKGPVFVPGPGASPGVSAGGVSAPLSPLGNASLPKAPTPGRYAVHAAPAASGASLSLPSAGAAARSKTPLSLISIDADRTAPVGTDQTTVQETGGGRAASIEAGKDTSEESALKTAPHTGGGAAAAFETLRLGEKAAAEALRPRIVSEESSASVGRPFDASALEEGGSGVSPVAARSLRAAARPVLEKAPAPADVRPAADPGAEEEVPPPSGGKTPKQSVSRAAKYGLVTGALMLAFNAGIGWAAEALGYVPHSNYEAPALPEAATLGDAGSLFFMAAVMAPIVEEIVFRAGLLSGIEWLTRKAVRRGAGVIASVLSSAVFVVLHETADPFLIGVRMAGALLMAYTYKREGLLASIVLHAVNNGVLIAGVLLSAFLPPAAAVALSIGGLVLGGGAAAWAGRGLWAQRRDRSEGRIGRYELTPKSALVLAALLGLGSLALSPQLLLVNLLFAAGLGVYAWRKRKSPA